MEAQGIEKETYLSIVVPVLMGKVLENIWNDMIRLATNHLEWKLGDMLKAFEKELDVLEGYVPVFSQARSGGRRQEQYRPRKRLATASALTSTNGRREVCLLFWGSHFRKL